MDSRIISQKFESVIRRELLKRTPVAVREAYNPLQKHLYTSAIGARGFVRADRFRHMEAAAIFLAGVDDRRFHWARLWHFLIMWALLAFVFGHLVMVVLHGWNFVSMSTGWKKTQNTSRSSVRSRSKATLTLW